MMNLNVNEDRFYDEPSEAIFREEIPGLDADEFAILADEEQHYLQTLRAEEGGFVVEYREGSADAHFGTAELVEDAEEVVQAFSLYLQRDPAWKSFWEWEKIEFDDEGEEMPR